MDLLALLESYGPWAWIVGGMVLLALELFVPGGFFLWLGAAGIVTGLASLFQPIPWALQWLIFGALSLVSIWVWLRYSRSRPQTTDRPYLNRRAEALVGREAVLDEPITNGFGRMALGDTLWRVSGPDLAPGHRVRVVGHDGPVLKVEAL